MELLCQCTGCKDPHTSHRCPEPAVWFLELHEVDNCSGPESPRGLACQQCFDNHTEGAEHTVILGAAGARPRKCRTCFWPLVKISDIIRDVGKLPGGANDQA